MNYQELVALLAGWCENVWASPEASGATREMVCEIVSEGFWEALPGCVFPEAAVDAIIHGLVDGLAESGGAL